MGEGLKVVVAEDEPYNRKRLARLLREAACDVVAELPDGPAVLEWLEAGGEADALFLDVQMPGASGLDVAQDLPRRIPVVFVTAFTEHAIPAFEADALDYLLKPATAERLAKTLARLRERLATPLPAVPRTQGPLRYAVKAGEGVLFLDLARTSHFVFQDDEVFAFLSGERYRTLWKSLTEVEGAFPEGLLLRAHRHLLIRPEAILGARTGTFGRMLVRVAGGLELDVSRGAAPRLRERLGLPDRGRS